MIDWESEQTSVILNPKISKEDQKEILDILSLSPPLKGHVWLATSGSNQVKWAALSKSALLESAQAVNRVLNSDRNDVWLNALPQFHVGGLSIFARSYLSQNTVVDAYELMKGKWNVSQYIQLLYKYNACFSSLVPAQVYDLVKLGMSPPPSLKAIVVGGGKLPQPFYEKAKSLNWKLLPSYGLTEASSQVATAEIHSESTRLKLLPHIEAKTDDFGRILIKSSSLLTLYCIKTSEGIQYQDPKINGWLQTEDIGNLSDGYLEVCGRGSDFIKIGGENVHLPHLEQLLDKLKLAICYEHDFVLLAVPDERLGHVIHAVSNDVKESSKVLAEAYNQMVLPFEKIRHLHTVSHIPRSPALKVLRHELMKSLSF